MKKLKIGILIDQLVPGGVQKSAIREAKELIKLHHQVTLFVLIRQKYSYQYQDLIKGLKVVFLSDYNPILFHKPINIPYFSFLTHLHILSPFFVQRYTMLKNLDFIISHGTTTCITAAQISKKLHVPYLAYIWDPMIFILEKVYGKTLLKYFFLIIRPITQFYEQRFLNAAALVATSSKVHQKYIYDKYLINPIIIFPGCETIKNILKKTDNYILGYSRWELAKNPMLFLQIAQKIPQVKILIAGAWTNLDELKKFTEKISSLKLENRIFLQTVVTDINLKKIAEKSFFWLHPNFEAFGMSGLEMAALGLPLIIPKGSGVTELFKNGVHGFFPNIYNRSEILNIVRYLYHHPQKARHMGVLAAKVSQQYTWEKHTKLVINVIKEYVNQKTIVCLANAFVAPFSIGGGDRFIIELARRIPDKFHMTVVLPYAGFYHWYQASVTNKNIRFIVLPKNIFDNIESPIPLFLTYLIRLIQTIIILPNLAPFQIIHSTTDMIPDVIPAYLFHKTHQHIPWVSRFFHFIENPFKREGRFWVNTGSYFLQQICLKLLRQSSAVLVDNTEIVDRLMKKGIAKNKVHLHSGGVSISEINNINLNESYKSDGIFIGRLQAHKGIFDAIEIWEKVCIKLPAAKLTIIGYGKQDILEKLKHKIVLAKLSKNIRLIGHLNDRELIFKYLKSSKILLFLDHEAGFGLVAAEAMAAGLPVISYNLPIFGNVYKKGFMASNLRDFQSITNNIINLLTQKNNYAHLSHLAKMEAQKFDWQLISNLFYKQIDAFIKNN